VSRSARVDACDGLFQDELRAILDDELARLPAEHRGPLVLCELEGLSRQEAARRLGLAEGTLSSRLSRAKARLRDRLARRGLVLTIGGLSLALEHEASAVALPELLIESTTQAAIGIAAGISASAVVSTSVASLTEGVLKVMLLAKLKSVAWGIGTMAVVVSGAVALAQPTGGSTQAGGGTQTESDRAAAMERKLDRIISALDRLSGTVGTSSTVITDPLAPERVEAEPTLPTSEVAATVEAVVVGDSPLTSADTHKLPLADRVEAVEQTLRKVRDRLMQLEQRFNELDKRVGGAAGSRVMHIDRGTVIPSSEPAKK
jgi:predicted DNA-binding protein (UPF0251 family)